MIKAQYDLNLTPVERLKQAGLRRAIRIGISRAAASVKAVVVSHAERVRLQGNLAKSIRIKTIVYPSGYYVAVVGPSTKFKRSPRGKIQRGPRKGQKRAPIKPSRYAMLLERGGKRQSARPWLAPAHNAAAPEYLRRVKAEVGKEIEKELARQAT